MKLKGIELVPGMIISANGYNYVVFPMKDKNNSLAFGNITAGGCALSFDESCIAAIRDCPISRNPLSGEVLWQRSYELTRREIAAKFGIPPEKMRIKD